MSDKSHQKFAVSWLNVSLLVLFSSINSKPLYAQVIDIAQQPNLLPPQDVQPSLPYPLPSPQLPQPLTPPSELLEPSSPDSSPSEPFPNKIPETFTVKRFEVVGSTVFSPQELAQTLAEFTNRPISIVELYQARAKITDLYVNDGYITSGAYIPPQKIQSGVAKIEVVERKVQKIEVTGTQRLSPNYVRSRIEAAISGPLNQKRLLEALQVLRLNPLIQNLSAELKRGSVSGTTVLYVQVEEAKTFSTQIVLDNGRTPAIGSFQRRVQISEANLLGLGDGLSVGYSNTDGSNFFYGSYTLPLNPKNGTLSFTYGTAESNIIERPFNSLDIEGASRYYELTYRQPIVETPAQEFAVGLTGSRQESETSYVPVGERLPFPSLGADESGRTRLTALRFFQEWTSRSPRQVIAVRSQFNLGISALDATINQEVPDSRFFSWQAQAQWARLLAPETIFLFRLNTQLSSTSLLPFEQFGLGGIDSIRGYRQDLLLDDNGAFASAEVQVPVLRTSGSNGLLQVIPFVDLGVAWNNSSQDNSNTNSPNTLASVGLGLRWSQGDRFLARLDWGIPLIAVDQPDRTWQENGIYFSVIYNPF